MIFHQFLNEESGCLSYLVGCGQAGEAVVVDPGRDRIDDYVRLARKKGLRITRIVETHTHADHISGNRDLAALVKAPILLHRSAKAAFEHSDLADGEELRIGTVGLKVLHTPGHTPDSMCLLVTDRSRGDEPWFVLTGDTLFIGDVGRPDLGGAQAASELYDSLRAALLPLPDSVEVHLIDRPGEAFLGTGEAAQGPTAAALANAFADATGTRIRELPLTPGRVKQALGV